MAEYIDIVNENGEPTGTVIDRETAHRTGIRHRTAHLWLARKTKNCTELLLQKRSLNKDSHPGCYDISSAGHIPAGVEPLPSALRELSEELGVTADASDIICCGKRCITVDAVFHGQPFHDRQVSTVYLLFADPKQFTLQTEEVESIYWMAYEECLSRLYDPDFPNCIAEEELLLLQPFLKQDI